MADSRNTTLPGLLRYQPKDLKDIFGHDNLFVPVCEVELATFDTLAEIGIIPDDDSKLLTPDLRARILSITTTVVEEWERKVTKHDVRALVQKIQELCPPSLARWWHVPLTSYDPLDTARSLQFRRAQENVLWPKMARVVKILQNLVLQYRDTLQIGRTHGQHALPITVGFWLATILNRLIFNCLKMDSSSQALVGKISGAVGAYNAQRGLKIISQHGPSFEFRVLKKLGLKPAPISTQILPPEPMAYFLFSCLMQSATLAQLGRDCRHLMRSEIAEIGEPFEEHQVGSSTMAQKRNPINFENLEGMYIRTKNEFGKVLDTMVSEHQRDLVGSSVARDFPIILVNLTQQLDTLSRADDKGVPFLSRVTVNRAALERNFSLSRKVVLAEPIYIALQMAGFTGDAHNLVNKKAMPVSQEKNISLFDAVKLLAQEDEDLAKALFAIPSEIKDLLNSPTKYTGLAEQKALQIADSAAVLLSGRTV